MITRLATLEDKEQVLRVLDELGEEINQRIGFAPHNKEAELVGGKVFEEVVKRDDTFIFVADDEGTIVGVITLYLLPNIRHGYHRGHIEDVVVAASHRRRGVASKLFDAVKKFCQERGIRVIKLDSGIENVTAHRFYEKNGGRQTELMFRFDL
jgi:ribosomal protein S18 acetylase RimI-like enzyme